MCLERNFPSLLGGSISATFSLPRGKLSLCSNWVSRQYLNVNYCLVDEISKYHALTQNENTSTIHEITSIPLLFSLKR